MKYEVFIQAGYCGEIIEADNEREAREQFAQTIHDNIGAEHIVANNLDTDDGNDPAEKE